MITYRVISRNSSPAPAAAPNLHSGSVNELRRAPTAGKPVPAGEPAEADVQLCHAHVGPYGQPVEISYGSGPAVVLDQAGETICPRCAAALIDAGRATLEGVEAEPAAERLSAPLLRAQRLADDRYAMIVQRGTARLTERERQRAEADDAA